MTLQEAFVAQARACAALGSPFMARLLRTLGENWHEALPLAPRFAAWKGDIGPSGASLPLRLAGGLHALVLSGKDPALAEAYAPVERGPLWPAVEAAMHRHAGFLNAWVNSPPQTNEVRRASVLIGAAHLLSMRFGLPLRLSELGASGGLNLMFDHFALNVRGERRGAEHPALTLHPDWHGPLPPAQPFTITERCGADLNPLDPQNPADALRLMAYLWPDQPERLQRTRAAIAINSAQLTRGDAVEWLETRLAAPQSGTLHLVYSTVAWQYFPQAAQARGQALMETAGAAATERAPLAWLTMEADVSGAEGAALELQVWPSGTRHSLGRADFHGRWVTWEVESLP